MDQNETTMALKHLHGISMEYIHTARAHTAALSISASNLPRNYETMTYDGYQNAMTIVTEMESNN